MAWRIEFEAASLKELRKLGHKAQQDILGFLEERIATGEDPRRFGEALRKNLAGLWRYRVGAYRIVCDIQDEKVLVLVVHLGHRREVYKN